MFDSMKRLQAIQQHVDSKPDFFYNGPLPLQDKDFLLIGKFVQTYSHADLCARRITNMIQKAIQPSCPINIVALSDYDMLKHLEAMTKKLVDSDIKDGILKAHAALELHRVHRHNFSHWVVRRVKNEDVFIMFSMNNKEATRRDGQSISPNHVKYGLAPISDLIIELEKLVGHTDYLAKCAYLLESDSKGLSTMVLREI